MRGPEPALWARVYPMAATMDPAQARGYIRSRAAMVISRELQIAQLSISRLSAKHQQIIMDVAERARKLELTKTAEAEIAAREYLKGKGVTFSPFPAAELAKWQKANPDFYGDWIKKMEKQGKGSEAKQTVELWKDLRSWINCP